MRRTSFFVTVLVAIATYVSLHFLIGHRYWGYYRWHAPYPYEDGRYEDPYRYHNHASADSASR